MKCLVPALAILLAACGWGAPASSQGIYFDDSAADVMVLGNATCYEIGFRKSNGSIAYVTDKSTGQRVTLGSRYGCLWGAVFPGGTPDFFGGCSYDAAGPNRFSYTWSAATHTLTFTYTPDPAASQQAPARVDVVASDDAWFDLCLQLQNDWGYTLDYVLFPCDMVFVEDDIVEALLPILPGVVLEPAFFEQDRTYTATYPGYPGLFADYVSLSSTQGHIAIYSLYGQGPIRPLVLGFIHDDEYAPDSTYYYHTFGARIGDGETWTTPWVRVRVSQPPLETIAAYRADNGLDQFPSLREKLGSRYTQVVRSPVYKADAVQLALPFSQYPDRLSRIPVPGILHPVAFQPGGHDESYPDFLPPDPAWGTTVDFAAMFEAAQAMGFLAMPYTNPTWWDDESPTLQDLPAPLTVADVAVLDDRGVPVYEHYGAHGGYVVSPHAPFVQQRLGQLVEQMTVDVPGDVLFEDQIGARPWPFDHNLSSPHPMAYIEGWLEHTRTYSDTLLMTELAFDRLAETEAGFHGSVLLPERFGYTPGWWGTGTWHPYPLAPLMARDKVLFYQHDLAPETFTVDKATLTWNLAFGYMLSHDLVETAFGGGLESEWLGLVGAFQRHVLARYADEAVTGFARLEGDVTRTAFETFSVIANWDDVNPYSHGQHTLPPSGVMVTGSNGGLTAGVFSAYNGAPLSPGDHYLIEERGLAGITVRQPIGADTALALELPPGWGPDDPIEAWACSAADGVIVSVPVTVTARGIAFVYRQRVAGQPVAYYEVADRALKPYEIFLPLILKMPQDFGSLAIGLPRRNGPAIGPRLANSGRLRDFRSLGGCLSDETSEVWRSAFRGGMGAQSARASPVQGACETSEVWGAACPARLRKSGDRPSEAGWARNRPAPRQFRALARLPKSGGLLVRQDFGSLAIGPPRRNRPAIGPRLASSGRLRDFRSLGVARLSTACPPTPAVLQCPCARSNCESLAELTISRKAVRGQTNEKRISHCRYHPLGGAYTEPRFHRCDAVVLHR